MSVFSIVFIAIVLFLGYILGSKSKKNSNQNSQFESGINSFGNTRINIPIKFYFIAISFITFDIEIVFLYIWCINIRELGWKGFLIILYFILTLLVLLLYLKNSKIFSILSNKRANQNEIYCNKNKRKK
ncbi:hypothetical protein AOQ89_01030 [bacterium endosymbiont of Pedicinus badii]|nr:hypothetical protein AOQ89_01030 [bacterium endosymbiont of Pedicinus badii]